MQKSSTVLRHQIGNCDVQITDIWNPASYSWLFPAEQECAIYPEPAGLLWAQLHHFLSLSTAFVSTHPAYNVVGMTDLGQYFLCVP